MAVVVITVIKRDGWLCSYCGHTSTDDDPVHRFCHERPNGAWITHDYVWVQAGCTLLEFDDQRVEV